MEHLHLRQTRRNRANARRLPPTLARFCFDEPEEAPLPDLRSRDERALLDLGFAPVLAHKLSVSHTGNAILARREAAPIRSSL
jgi:hypothetical protein